MWLEEEVERIDPHFRWEKERERKREGAEAISRKRVWERGRRTEISPLDLGRLPAEEKKEGEKKGKGKGKKRCLSRTLVFFGQRRVWAREREKRQP